MVEKQLKIAFVGFRHGHIMGLFETIRTGFGDTMIAGICEEDAQAREELARSHGIQATHERFDDLLDQGQFDIVAVGDYYSKHGPLTIKSLQAGKHVICDKPICTTGQELATITGLVQEKQLSVGSLFDLRGIGAFQTAARVIGQGQIGDVQSITFYGQHPLKPNVRPQWYFKPGCHGGTINDLAIHAIDAVDWLAQRKIVQIAGARTWHGRGGDFAGFQDGAHVMFALDNGGGALGDFSYLAPDQCCGALPQYWRITCYGTNGMLETSLTAQHVGVATHEDREMRWVDPDAAEPNVCLQDFLDEVRGRQNSSTLTTTQVLRATKIALTAQRAADEGLTPLPCDLHI